MVVLSIMDFDENFYETSIVTSYTYFPDSFLGVDVVNMNDLALLEQFLKYNFATGCFTVSRGLTRKLHDASEIIVELGQLIPCTTNYDDEFTRIFFYDFFFVENFFVHNEVHLLFIEEESARVV